ncbi:MAG: hypothetical protein HOV92_09485 [Streptomyces sp.]|nr:hypothetical protein [Streptomyces sp.]
MATQTTTPRPQDQLPPTQTRWMAGARHTSAAITHWAGGYTISAEELTRRIVKARLAAHTQAGAEHTRLAQTAHNRATKLRRRAEQNGGLVAADQSALAAAEREAAWHDAAFTSLGEFEVPALDPGQIRHRRHRTAFARCLILALPVHGILAAAWLWSGTVVLVAATAALAWPLVRGDRPYDLTVRPVPPDLLAATPMVTPTAPAPAAAEAPAVDTGAWKEQLRLYVEHALAAADLEGRSGVHCADLLHGLQQSGEFLGLTTATFPAKLRDVGIPTQPVKIAGDAQQGVRHDALTKALGHMPRLPAHLVPDLTEDAEEEPSQSSSPSLTKAR